MIMEYKNHCRTCLSKGKEMRHIESTVTIGGSKVRLLDILLNFYDYKVSPEEYDTYPVNICINCVHHLTLTHSFKSLIDSSWNKLQGCSIKSYDEGTSYDYNYDYDSDDYKPIIVHKVNKQVKRKVIESKHRKVKQKLTKQKHIEVKGNVYKKQIYCVECKQDFFTTDSLKEHCSEHHPVRSTVGRDCEYCYEKFDDFKELVIHRKLHLKPYLCLICWTGFVTENELKDHTCQPHLHRRSTGEKPLRQCDQCGKSYPPGYIKIHMATHGNELKYACKYCPKKFKVANGLNSHVLWNHKRTRNHKCEVCGAMFISASSRSSHVRKNHLKEKKYGCESCAKRFFSKSELERHMLTHTGVKNFHCHLCDKSYQTKYGLNVHLKSHNHINVNNIVIM